MNRPTEQGHQAQAIEMLALDEGPCFTFRFADDRLIPLPPGGLRVSVFKIDTAERLRLLTATARVSEGGWASSDR